MPSQRRVRLILVAALAATAGLLLFTSSHARHPGPARGRDDPDPRRPGDFYDRTVAALQAAEEGEGVDRTAGRRPGSPPPPSPAPRPRPADLDDHDHDHEHDHDLALTRGDMADRLRAAEQQAKDLANQKAPLRPDWPSDVIGVGSSAGGQSRKKEAAAAAAEEKAETEEDHAAEVELNSILKRAPVIIFSKTYCPHSRRAKAILLDRYAIDPPPLVVELDEHPHGPALQAQLARRTGRRTVPNVLVGGASVGGGDDVAALDVAGTLAEKLEYLGGGSRLRVRERGGGESGL